ncbi:MAG: hypothetical protein IJC34_05255 [Lentisphaeria bacterium]|nr:hypothetical protein [Lentisphaeria bacterium]
MEYLAYHGTVQQRRAQKGDRWLAKHFVQSAWCGQSMSDRSDQSDRSDEWHRVHGVPCAPEFPMHRVQKWGALGCGAQPNAPANRPRIRILPR